MSEALMQPTTTFRYRCRIPRQTFPYQQFFIWALNGGLIQHPTPATDTSGHMSLQLRPRFGLYHDPADSQTLLLEVESQAELEAIQQQFGEYLCPL